MSVLFTLKSRNFWPLLLCCICLSGCGATKNIVKLMQSDTSTYTFGQPFVQRFDPSSTRVFIRIMDISCLNPKMHKEMYEKIKQNLVSKGFHVVDRITDSNVLFSIVMKNFGKIADTTVDNLEKYAQYRDVLSLTYPKDYSISTNSASFAVADQSISIASSGSAGDVRPSSTFSKLTSIDFASGAAIGTLSAFLIAGSNPITMVLGGIVGAVATSILQIITEPNNYSGTLSIKIAQRASHSLSSKTKVLQTSGNNSITEMELQNVADWVDYNSDFMIVISSSARYRARKKFAAQALYVASNMF